MPTTGEAGRPAGRLDESAPGTRKRQRRHRRDAMAAREAAQWRAALVAPLDVG